MASGGGIWDGGGCCWSQPTSTGDNPGRHNNDDDPLAVTGNALTGSTHTPDDIQALAQGSLIGLGPNGLGPNGLGQNDLGPSGLVPGDLGRSGLGPSGLGPSGLGPNTLGSSAMGRSAGDVHSPLAGLDGDGLSAGLSVGLSAGLSASMSTAAGSSLTASALISCMASTSADGPPVDMSPGQQLTPQQQQLLMTDGAEASPVLMVAQPLEPGTGIYPGPPIAFVDPRGPHEVYNRVPLGEKGRMELKAAIRQALKNKPELREK
ncbi:hypothetical protein GNI_098360 [Gregarina niphandrodes]|uniref:Uncharacterized protein n=1 Tax=Gregarina niphandrodes TaxID=110365 RepID=A0A023B4Y9_GRENI|nr:hypothetical protein GNI_098360 [Gregarina niphandrodes]EZG57278.1 hypothetical protein GNI_098360 [Gregarina niphandrodes]|eukprot:XP_011131062.1 hypothetical protein GNI_098360 [Gregarina niphandrodes]